MSIEYFTHTVIDHNCIHGEGCYNVKTIKLSQVIMSVPNRFSVVLNNDHGGVRVGDILFSVRIMLTSASASILA